MLKPGDSQRVAELMRETAAAELLPRFRNLAKEDVRQKRPGDFVTVADLASEQRLASGLARILPGVPVVGEEAVENEPGLDRLIRVGYGLLHLVTFFTVGPKETRAWTVTQGSRAPQAAGVIHTDFERGFIRAETIAYDDYVKGGGEAGARDIGKLRLEGKEYVVADGDVMHFRFAT